MAVLYFVGIIISVASFGFLVIKLSLQTHDVKESQLPIQKNSIKKIKIDISMSTYDKFAEVTIKNPGQIQAIVNKINHLTPTMPFPCKDTYGTLIEMFSYDKKGNEIQWTMKPSCQSVVSLPYPIRPPYPQPNWYTDHAGLILLVEKDANWYIDPETFILKDDGIKSTIHFIGGGAMTVPLYPHSGLLSHIRPSDPQSIEYIANGTKYVVNTWYQSMMGKYGFRSYGTQKINNHQLQDFFMYRSDGRYKFYINLKDSNDKTEVEIDGMKTAIP